MWGFFNVSPASVYVSAPQEVFPAATTEFIKVWPRLVSGGDSVFLPNRRPSLAPYAVKGRIYAVGMWPRPMMLTETWNFIRQFVAAPTGVFTLTAGAGPGVTSNGVGYISYFDSTHNRRSPLSQGVSLSLVNQARVWGDLPSGSEVVDDFVDQIELWWAPDGNAPRLVTRLNKGVTTYTEAVASLTLGEAFVESWLEFPECLYNTIWNYRQVLAGDAVHPDRIYFSLLAEPEKYGGFSLRTKDGQPVTGLLALRDVLVVTTPVSSFAVTGFTEDDIEIEYLEPGVGCIGHHLLDRFHNYGFVPYQGQPYLCTGTSMHPIGRDIKETWRQHYRDNKVAYEQRAWARVDPETETIIVNTDVALTNDNGEKFSDAQKCSFVIDYQLVVPEAGGGYAPPDITVDAKTRRENCAAALSGPDGSRQWFFVGCDDGYVRRCNVASNYDDDADTYGKKWILQTGHDMQGVAGGDDFEGKKLETLTVFAESEASAYTVKVFAGDAKASLSNPASWVQTVSAGAAVSPVTGNPLVPKTQHFSKPGCPGRGHTFRLEQANGKGVFAGIAGTWTPGLNNRPQITP